MTTERTRPRAGFRLLQKSLRAFFHTFYLLEVSGLEHVPTRGPVIVCANHVNPFDAIILGACLPRRIRFVAWNRTFSKPVIGSLLRLTGCIPIDRDRPNLSAFKESLRWLAAGNILGIFPEGKYTDTGHLAELKPGTARIALSANATVVPATLTGAYRAWPLRGLKSKMFPRPWKIALKFHPAIEPGRLASGTVHDQRAVAQQLIDQIGAAIDSTLKPAIRAEGKIDALVEQPAPHIRLYEWFLCVVLLVTLRRLGAVVAMAYFAYLLADILWIPQSRLTRFLRNFSTPVALAAAYPVLVDLIGPPPQGPWLASYAVVLAYTLWAMIHYCFTKYLRFQRFVRGWLLTLYLGLLEQMWLPWIERPTLIISLAVFTLAFDFANNRNRFWTAVVVVPVTLAVAASVRGYSGAGLLASVLTVMLVYAYTSVFKFRAHDGQRI